MFIIYGSTREEIQGPNVEINCPKCGQLCQASSVEIIEWVKLFIVIPILRLRNTYLTCTHCGKSIHVKARLEDLSYITTEDMDDMLAGTQGSSMMSFFAILALLFCLLPFIGLTLAVISVILSRKITGWQKIISYIALVLSLIFTIFVISGWF